jgi:gluconokinase
MPADRQWQAVVVVMGVSGSGKSTVGELIAGALGADFLDADPYHPAENVAKMQAGHALTDADRLPWLEKLRELLNDPERKAHAVVLACSALKRAYRDHLRRGERPVHLVYLHGREALLRKRLGGRAGHFFNPTLLESQLESLEEPAPEEQAIWLEINKPADYLARAALAALGNLQTRVQS